LSEGKFASGSEVKDAVHLWLLSQPETFFADWFRRLVNFYTTCLERMDDYDEK
jgi:hypothetical protein